MCRWSIFSPWRTIGDIAANDDASKHQRHRVHRFHRRKVSGPWPRPSRIIFGLSDWRRAGTWNVWPNKSSISGRWPASVSTEEDAARLKTLLGANATTEICFGDEGLCRVAGLDQADTLVSAVVGCGRAEADLDGDPGRANASLWPTRRPWSWPGNWSCPRQPTIKAEILPVDSEHSAIFQALCGYRTDDCQTVDSDRFGRAIPRLDHGRTSGIVTPRQALAHPNWSMGAKISIDSATLMNKGLEAIEARWLFGLDLDRDRHSDSPAEHRAFHGGIHRRIGAGPNGHSGHAGCPSLTLCRSPGACR